jgi:hypothetical protein
MPQECSLPLASAFSFLGCPLFRASQIYELAAHEPARSYWHERCSAVWQQIATVVSFIANSLPHRSDGTYKEEHHADLRILVSEVCQVI